MRRIVEAVEGVGSYGVSGGKRLYVGYNRERKVAGRYFSLMLDVYIGEEQEEGIPSLLGRDVLNRCRCAIDASSGRALLDPVVVDEASGSIYYPPAVRRLG